MAQVSIDTIPRRFWASALPTSGTFFLGDRISITGSASEYVCTTAGTAGAGAVFTSVGATPAQTQWAARKTAATTVNNVATRAIDPDLQVTLPGGTAAYRITAHLVYEATTTADLSIGWTGPSGATMSNWSTGGAAVNASSNISGVVIITYATIATPGVLGGAGAGSIVAARPMGVLEVGATGGTFGLTWAQNTAEVSDTKIHPGSYLVVEKIA